MPEIVLTDITKRWKGFYAVENLNLKIADNAFVTLLGPSGCGKTTTLRMIAGLETPTSGRITIGDRVVFDSDAGINVPPNKRKVGFLFQNYALWPNMTVYQNIAFGLENVKDELPAVDFKAREAAKMIEILSAPQKVLDVVAECYDKNNKLDKSKLSLHLIDTFTISQYTAKKLMALELQSAADVNKTAEEQKKSYEKILADQQAAAASSGQSLNENCEFVKDGKVVTSLRKLTKEEIDLSVRRVSRIVKIGIFMDRYPAELSGGQQQRVAIARTLAPEPSVLFMDEPLSNLDAKLRLEMRSELQRLHIETGSTFVYVTHDQMEAMTLATEICLINNGVLQQYDAPLTVYGRPNNTFVADFVGNPSINFVETQANEKGSELELSFFEGQKAVFTPVDGTVLADWTKADHAKDEALAAELKAKLQDKKYVEKSNKDVLFKCPIPRIEESELETEREITDQDLILAIRPEAISICEDGKLEGEIYSAMPTGMEITVRVRIGNFLLTGVAFGGITYKIGQKVRLNFTGDGILLYSARSGRLITAGSLKLL